MKNSTRSRLVFVAAVCAAIAGCSNDEVAPKNTAAPAPVTAAKAADCSSHEAEIVKLSGALAVSEAKAADLQDRVDELEAAPKVASAAKAKVEVCQVCPEQEACPTVAEAPPAADCPAVDPKLEARYEFLSKTVAELEVENYLNEHKITEIEKTVGKAKK